MLINCFFLFIVWRTCSHALIWGWILKGTNAYSITYIGHINTCTSKHFDKVYTLKEDEDLPIVFGRPTNNVFMIFRHFVSCLGFHYLYYKLIVSYYKLIVWLFYLYFLWLLVLSYFLWIFFIIFDFSNLGCLISSLFHY